MLTYFKITSINIFKIHLDSANLQVFFDILSVILKRYQWKTLNLTYFKITLIHILKIHLDSANLEVLFDISSVIPTCLNEI